MKVETLNRTELLNKFQQFLQDSSSIRIIRLLGDTKTGKSHFLTKVLPLLARQKHHVECIVIDLRSPMQSIPDLLHIAYRLLGGEVNFQSYHIAYEEWLSRPNMEVKSLRSFFSLITIRSKDEVNDYNNICRHLTDKFVYDISNILNKQILFLFDSIEDADNSTKNWIMNNFLVQLSKINHVKVVIAGRSVPEINNSYVTICESYNLAAVQNIDDYIQYCYTVGAKLPEESIRDIALILDYNTGLFVELVIPKFTE